MKKNILLVSSGYHLYRKYLLEMISQHASIYLLLDREPTWEKPFIHRYEITNTLCAKTMENKVRSAYVDIKLDGVICWDEIRMLPTAILAEKLGLLYSKPSSVAKCRDKAQTRVAMDACGISQPKSFLVETMAEALTAVDNLSFPVVLKPRSLGASFGVSVVHGKTELEAAFKHAQDAREAGVPVDEQRVLIEEFVEGEEISIDSAVVNGVVYPLYLARKETDFFPYCEEIGHTVDAADPLLANEEIKAFLVNLHQAVNFTYGMTHVELKLTENGPKLIEVNCRLGGGLILMALS
ncbi:ATP-grasp domain-containing protein [Facilibium subflavum]|uniref:ATP-grasp domain-containing protein n=1 Tax=Facilibium subflavum TaxID=2219058 RepID=UPI000E65379B|nr:ATP-grasp domain-containing protein [Facilibium subflavum]